MAGADFLKKIVTIMVKRGEERGWVGSPEGHGGFELQTYRHVADSDSHASVSPQVNVLSLFAKDGDQR